MAAHHSFPLLCRELDGVGEAGSFLIMAAPLILALAWLFRQLLLVRSGHLAAAAERKAGESVTTPSTAARVREGKQAASFSPLASPLLSSPLLLGDGDVRDRSITESSEEGGGWGRAPSAAGGTAAGPPLWRWPCL